MNNFSLVGRIFQEPELLETGSGIKMCKLKISVDKVSKEEDTTDVFDVALFRDNARDDYKVGQYVAINGKLSSNNKNTKDGNTFYNISLIGNSISVLAH